MFKEEQTCGARGATDIIQVNGDPNPARPDLQHYAEVPAGTKWWVGVCDPAAPGYPAVAPESGRFIDHRLANKEFDEPRSARPLMLFADREHARVAAGLTAVGPL